MRKIGLFLLFISCFQVGTAQYTELINSRRPGFTDSPYSIGTNVLQVESGLFYENQNDKAFKFKSFGTDIMLRYGRFFEKLEFDLNLAFQHDKVTFANPLLNPNVTRTGLSRLTIGAKYLVYMPTYKDKSKEIRSWKKKMKYDWKRLIPSVGVYAGANLPITKHFIGGNSPQLVEDSFSPRIALYTQNDFTDRFIFLMNLIADRIGSGQQENSYILTGTYTVNEKLSAFIEHQGIFKDDNIPNDFQFGGGMAYLLSKDMQVDASIRTIKDRDGSTFLFSAGFAWRIMDKHQDAYKIVDSEGNVTKTEKKGNFFSRLFGKKKDKKLRKVKKVKAKKRKIKELKPKKSKKQKIAEKAARKKVKQDKKKKKKKAKDYNKNYEPPKDNTVDDNN
jgi:hypothetical protein